MPIYEYYCADCQTAFETLRPMSKADTPIACQHCQSMDTSRTLSLFAAHVKGKATDAGNGHSHARGGCACGGGGCGCGHHH